MTRANERRIPIPDAVLYEMKKTMTYAQMHKVTGIKPSTIQMSLKRHGFAPIINTTITDKRSVIYGYKGECPICGKTFVGTASKQYCSKQCGSISYKATRNANKSAMSRYTVDILIDKDINLRKLYKRDDGKCYICGCQTSFEDKVTSNRGNLICGKTYPSIDHVIPLKRGGLHEWKNVRLACLDCNRKKGAREYNGEKLGPLPEIDKELRRESQGKTVYQYSKDHKLVGSFNSMAKAEELTGITRKNISKVCNGRNKTAGGYIWSFGIIGDNCYGQYEGQY